jgi:hypothetical protein
MPDTILLVLSHGPVPVPAERLQELAIELRSREGTFSVRAKIERALAANAAAVRFDRYEKATLLDALNQVMRNRGVDAIGPELTLVHGELEYDLGLV